MQSNRDMHSSLKTETLGTASGQGIEVILQRLQWSREDIAYSVHVRSTSFSLSGLQATDLLSYLGFQRTACPVCHGDGYCKFVQDGFDISAFAESFGKSYAAVVAAERHLPACGLRLPQPEGWGHFFGRATRASSRAYGHSHGDGHTSPKTQRMKVSEDENFRFSFTWMEGGRDKGWTTHYAPKNGPLSPQVSAVFTLLGLQPFDSCPEFDFEGCHWRFIPFGGDEFFGNADVAHGFFDSIAAHFSPGVEQLLAAYAHMEPFGLSLLPIPSTAPERRRAQIAQHTSPAKVRAATSMPDTFDVAISFAGTDRQEAEKIAHLIEAAGFRVFYDDLYGAALWGQNLVDLFDDIYRKRARFCVIFVSEQYLEREWTNHERQSAQARALKEKGSGYILPIKVDDVELPGMAPSVGYVSLRQHGIEDIGRLLIEKLGAGA